MEKLTKFGLVFKPQKGHIEKGKAQYLDFQFEIDRLLVCLEASFKAGESKITEISYSLLENWEGFKDQLMKPLLRTQLLANGLNPDEVDILSLSNVVNY